MEVHAFFSPKLLETYLLLPTYICQKFISEFLSSLINPLQLDPLISGKCEVQELLNSLPSYSPKLMEMKRFQFTSFQNKCLMDNAFIHASISEFWNKRFFIGFISARCKVEELFNAPLFLSIRLIEMENLPISSECLMDNALFPNSVLPSDSFISKTTKVEYSSNTNQSPTFPASSSLRKPPVFTLLKWLQDFPETRRKPQLRGVQFVHS